MKKTMEIKHLCWLICFLFATNAAAQEEKLELFTLKNETFDKDDNTWTKREKQTAGDSLAISDGYFYWRSQSPQLLQLARAASRLNERREHTITTRIIRQSLQNEHRIMLLFGYGNGDYWAVAIKRGDFQITGRVDGLTRELTPYKKSAAVRTDTNDIRVHHRINQVDFYINDVLVHSHPKTLKYASDGVGFAQSGNGSMRIDFLKVEQWDTPMRILPDADLFGEPERLSDNINTEYPDYVPIISHDGQHLYFIRRDAPYINSPKNKSDIFVSPLLPDGSWGAAVQLDTPINNQYNNAVCTVMPDNNTLYLLNQYKRDGVAPGIALTRRGKDGWEYPINQVIDNYANKSNYADMFVTPNGKVMILAVEMPQTEGERDLYVSFLLEPNRWSSPQNMGKVLNTFGSEFGPYLAADGKSLYFCSMGHAGYGSADVFVSRRLDDTWLNWSEPYNLGPKVNTPNFDAYYTIPAKGDYAYYVSNSPETKADIYRIRLSPMARPEQTVIVEGYVKDSKTEQPILAEISYESLTKGQELGIARPRVEDGYYQIMLTFGEHYGIMAAADGYFPVGAQVDLKDKKQEKTDEVLRIRRDLYLAKLEKNAAIRLNNLFFDSNKYELLPASVTELQRLIVLLERNPTLTIQLEGHTDDIGTDSANKTLSERRVQAVRSFLIDKNIKAERLKFVGYGESKPIVKNTDDESRAKNRRVEFRVLSE
jgi:outer membrane protein OmpA-like peptidoglycan-associated protein